MSEIKSTDDVNYILLKNGIKLNIYEFYQLCSDNHAITMLIDDDFMKKTVAEIKFREEEN